MDITGFLTAVESFHGLQEQELAALAAAARTVRFADGETVVRAGEKGDAVWVVAEGTAEVTKAGRGGEHKTLAILAAGELFGEMSIMAREPATADVRARGTLKAIEIPGEVFFRTFHKNFKALGKLSRDMAKRYSRIARN